MSEAVEFIRWVALIPVLGGSIFAILAALAVLRFFHGRPAAAEPSGYRPPVTILKPICGLEKCLADNLRSVCLQNYPEYQVLFCVQDRDDPALPILYALQEEFGPERVSVAVGEVHVGSNNKVNNLLGAMPEARHDILVISDSDAVLRPDYLDAIVAPLADPEVGLSCTPFKLVNADRWFERLELLSINAEFMPSVVFSAVTGASNFCLGPSVAMRRQTLEEVGGFASLADFLVEDYELGRRVWASGRRTALVRHVIDVVVDLGGVREWWTHQLYWDQNTRLARPAAFFSTILVRSVPFALLFALLRPLDPSGWIALAAAIGVRVAGAGIAMKWGFRDGEGLASLALLPLRDVAGLAIWALAYGVRTVVWRGVEFSIEAGGRMRAVESRGPIRRLEVSESE